MDVAIIQLFENINSEAGQVIAVRITNVLINNLNFKNNF